MQLLAADGSLVAQQDHPPRNGFLPTSIWKSGLIVSDPYTLVVPQDANSGAYSLIAGMYDLESGTRLPVWKDGKSMGDTIMLAHVEVQ